MKAQSPNAESGDYIASTFFNQRISSIVHDFDDYDPMEYLNLLQYRVNNFCVSLWLSYIRICTFTRSKWNVSAKRVPVSYIAR